ncbi:hypothetical protein [Syntrophus aciditrophicus]|uniref:Hypothetical cytosolic protein n=1 Tax=Syntrophus aciditrophicus (strain SB) TaxID=56780 RepID=Q2LWB9_SYNAS|nr:hypothetical protein [Syntrophus aciditrophicus]ABC78376.1 hypothetical cytosolic protein [Syntrophus aciditrophicus SB]OPY16976.1 MAG: hypothetical protein A4E74_01599 [Syntrophus sp. PtaB.Bin075]
MTLDEPKENDTIFIEQGITFAIDRDLLEKAGPIQLDYSETGFQLTSSLAGPAFDFQLLT